MQCLPKRCCCCSLADGVYWYALYSMFVSSCAIVFGIYGELNDEDDNKIENSDTSIIGTSFFKICYGSLGLIYGFVLFFAVLRGHSKAVLYYIIHIACFHVTMLLYSLSFTRNTLNDSIHCLWIGLTFIHLIYVYAYYKELKAHSGIGSTIAEEV